MKKIKAEKIYAENLESVFDRDETLFDIGTDINDEICKEKQPKITMWTENIDGLKELLKGEDYLYGYNVDLDLKWKANKKDISIDGNRVDIYKYKVIKTESWRSE